MTEKSEGKKIKGLIVRGLHRCGQHVFNFILFEETVMSRTDYARSYLDQLAEDDDYANLYNGYKLINLVVDEIDAEIEPEEDFDIEWVEAPVKIPALSPDTQKRPYRDTRDHRWHHVPGGRSARPNGKGGASE